MTENEEFELYIQSFKSPEDAEGLRKLKKTKLALLLLTTIDDYCEQIERDHERIVDYKDSAAQYILTTDTACITSLQPSDVHKLSFRELPNGYVVVGYDNHFQYTVDFLGNIGRRLSSIMTDSIDSEITDPQDVDGLDDYEVEYYATEAANA